MCERCREGHASRPSRKKKPCPYPPEEPYQGERHRRVLSTNYRTVKAPEHPLANQRGVVLVNRAVLYDELGDRRLNCYWCERQLFWRGVGIEKVVADHLDGNRLNNQPNNLVPACRICNSNRARRPDFFTHCPAGHPWTGDNLINRAAGRRDCKTCHRGRARSARAAVRKEAA